MAKRWKTTKLTDESISVKEMLFSKDNVKQLYQEIKDESQLPINSNFVDSLLAIIKRVWTLPNTRKFVHMNSGNPQEVINELNGIVKKKGIAFVSEQYDKKQKIDEVFQTRNELRKLYNESKNKEHFQTLVQTRIPLDRLLSFLKASDSGLIDDDELSRFINEYIQSQQRKDKTRAGFVDDRPLSEVAVDQEHNLKFDFPVSDATKTYIIHTDSRNRNVHDWPLPNRYRFDFVAIDDPAYERSLIRDLFKITNVLEVRLLTATFNNFELLVDPVVEDPYLFIDLDEIEGNTHPSTVNGHRVFGRLQNVEARTVLNRYIRLDTTGCVRSYNIRQTLDSLSSLTVNLLDLTGQPFDFGPDGLTISASVGNPTTITTLTPLEISTGDRVYIIGFDNGIQIENTNMNNPRGHIATVLNPLQFTIPVEVTVASEGAIVLVAFRQHSLTFSVKSLSERSSYRFPKQPPPIN